MNRVIKRAANLVHRGAAVSRTTAATYFRVLSAVSRCIDRPGLTQRIVNSVSETEWPPLKFGPQRVRICGVEMWLHPHMGEPDFETLFARSLGYEEGTSFAWLERHSSEFDAVIEIGSNVGVYTVFLDHLARRPETRVTDIYAFEPSPGAFARLNSNLAANQCAHVTCCNVAVAECGGLLPFFEPEGHLTNGSFEREFAAQFTTNVSQRLVPAIAAQALESLFQRHERILIKIDVEGYEPKLISALASIISRYRPIILIEVLESTAAALNSTTCLHAYRAYLLDEGTSQHS